MTTSEHADKAWDVTRNRKDIQREPNGSILPRAAFDAGFVAALAPTPSPAQPTEAGEREHANRYGIWNGLHKRGCFDEECLSCIPDSLALSQMGIAPSPVQGALSAEERGIIIDALIEHERTSTTRKAANSASNSDERAEMCKALIVRLGSPVQGADDRLAQAEVIPLTPDEARETLGMSRDEPNAATGYNTRKAYEALTATYQQSPQTALNEVRAGAWDEGYGLGVEVGHRGDDYWETNPYRAAELRAAPQTK